MRRCVHHRASSHRSAPADPGLTQDEVAAYIARLDLEPPLQPTLESLRALVKAHLLHVPFETLSSALKEEAKLDDVHSVVHKIVVRRRGGICYETNGAFAALLSALGFHTKLMGSRVNYNAAHEGSSNAADAAAAPFYGPPMDHLTLCVTIAGRDYLADVGWGRFTSQPLDLGYDGVQHDRFGEFEIKHAQAGDLEVYRNGKVMFCIETRERQLAEFAATCWMHFTLPASPLTQVRLPLHCTADSCNSM